MALTIDQLSVMPFGYLSGADLLQYGPAQILISQYAKFPASLKQGCNAAYQQAISNLINRYDIDREMAQKPPIQATIGATITGGALTAIPISDAGGKYDQPPQVTIPPPPAGGTQAAATAVLTDGVLTGFTITQAGSQYVAPIVITLSGGLAADPREQYLVQIVSLLAIGNIFGSSQNLSEFLMSMISQARKDLLAIRNAQANLKLYPVPQTINPDTQQPNPYPQSDAGLISSSFQYLG